MRRDVVWQRLDRPGLEHLALEARPDFVRAESFLLLQLDQGLAQLRYAIEADGAWRTQRADLVLTIGTVEHRLDLRRDSQDNWTANGAARPDLQHCFEIDLAATPFTNTPALRRLDLVEGEPKRMMAAYITVPELQVRVDEQEYTLLNPDRFRYRGLSTNFEAEVTMDADGLVVDYPPGWKRRSV